MREKTNTEGVAVPEVPPLPPALTEPVSVAPPEPPLLAALVSPVEALPPLLPPVVLLGPPEVVAVVVVVAVADEPVVTLADCDPDVLALVALADVLTLVVPPPVALDD